MENEQNNLNNNPNNFTRYTANNFWPQTIKNISEIKDISNNPNSFNTPEKQIAKKIRSIETYQEKLNNFEIAKEATRKEKEPLLADLFDLEEPVNDFLSASDDNLEKILDNQTAEKLLQLINLLKNPRNEKEKDETGIKIIKQYFGLEGNSKKTVIEIANECGLSRSRIQQIIKHRLKRLQRLAIKTKTTINQPEVNNTNDSLPGWHLYKTGYIPKNK